MSKKRLAFMYGGEVPQDWAARVYAEAIRVAEGHLSEARREGRMYSSYAVWAERLERELAALKQLANREGSWTKKTGLGQSSTSQK